MDELINHLEGRVFHVTKDCYWQEIKEKGQIDSNIKNDLETSFGCSNSS